MVNFNFASQTNQIAIDIFDIFSPFPSRPSYSFTLHFFGTNSESDHIDIETTKWSPSLHIKGNHSKVPRECSHGKCSEFLPRIQLKYTQSLTNFLFLFLLQIIHAVTFCHQLSRPISYHLRCFSAKFPVIETNTFQTLFRTNHILLDIHCGSCCGILVKRVFTINSPSFVNFEM